MTKSAARRSIGLEDGSCIVSRRNVRHATATLFDDDDDDDDDCLELCDGGNEDECECLLSLSLILSLSWTLT